MSDHSKHAEAHIDSIVKQEEEALERRSHSERFAEPSDTDQELTPGDRVEGLGNFGKPNGEFRTVERANDEDAVVKWDDDGRIRIHQPSLKKI